MWRRRCAALCYVWWCAPLLWRDTVGKRGLRHSTPRRGFARVVCCERMSACARVCGAPAAAPALCASCADPLAGAGVQMELDLLVRVRLRWQPPTGAPERDSASDAAESGDGVGEVVRPHSVGGTDSVIDLCSTPSVVDLCSTSPPSVVDLCSTSPSVVDVGELSCVDDDSGGDDDDDEAALPVQLPTCCLPHCEAAACVVVWQCAHVWCVHHATNFDEFAIQSCPVCRCELLVE